MHLCWEPSTSKVSKETGVFFFSYCTCSGRAALHVSEQIHVLSLEKESVLMFGGIGHAPVH